MCIYIHTCVHIYIYIYIHVLHVLMSANSFNTRKNTRKIAMFLKPRSFQLAVYTVLCSEFKITVRCSQTLHPNREIVESACKIEQ